MSNEYAANLICISVVSNRCSNVYASPWVRKESFTTTLTNCLKCCLSSIGEKHPEPYFIYKTVDNLIAV